jgi:hypothetical protein
VADDLEGTMVEGTDEGRITRGAGSEDIPKQTLNIRRLLRQVRWSFLPSDEISELRSGPFLGLSDPGIELQLEDLCREADRAVDTVRDVIQQVQHVVELSNALKNGAPGSDHPRPDHRCNRSPCPHSASRSVGDELRPHTGRRIPTGILDRSDPAARLCQSARRS